MARKAASFVVTALLTLYMLSLLILFLPVLAGYRPYAIVSGSMEPTLKVGSVIFVKPVAPETLKEGDIITFSLNGAGTVVTHRAVFIDRETKMIATKGDANSSNDASLVPFGNVYGKVGASIPYLGYEAAWFQDNNGKVALISLLLVLLILSWMLAPQEAEKGLVVAGPKREIVRNGAGGQNGQARKGE